MVPLIKNKTKQDVITCVHHPVESKPVAEQMGHFFVDFLSYLRTSKYFFSLDLSRSFQAMRLKLHTVTLKKHNNVAFKF